MAKKLKIRTTIKSRTVPPNFFSVFNKEAFVKANKVTRETAKQVAKDAKDVIRNQEFDWEPLDPGYKETKKKKGLDERILIATKDYVNNGIGWWEKEGRIFVGPRRGIHKPSGVPYQTLARWLEFGTWKMPARQLWRPLLSRAIQTSKAFAREYKKGVARAHKDATQKKVVKKTKKRG